MRTRAEFALVALLSTLFAACCMTGQPDTRCRGDTATIKYAPGLLQVSPECLEVDAGGSITLKLEGAPLEPGKARTRPDRARGDGDEWLGRENTERDRIVIDVPTVAGQAGTGPCGKKVCDFKYEIVIEGVGVLDPRIRVNY